MTGANRQRIVVLLSVIVAASANAAPTLDSHYSKFITCSVSRSSDTQNVTLTEQNQITKLTDSHLYAIAGEFLKPPASLMGSSDTLSYAKSLPPVPAAFFMVLVGFICVSLVKDRKVWLAGFVSLLCMGQAGFNTLPRLASHLISKRQIKQHASAFDEIFDFRFSIFDFSTGDIKVTQYIGLLHYLEGIPASKRLLSLPIPSLRAQRSNLNNQRNTRYEIRNTSKSLQFAILQLFSDLTPPTSCLAYKAEQFITFFSPAFIFSCLARSPPELA
jgi:hypothetical protein